MDLRRLISTAWKHKWMMVMGLVIGAVLAVLTLYTVSFPAGGFRPRFVENSHATYETEVQLMLFDPGFGIGRAGQEIDRPDSFRRTVDLAPSYAQLLTSDPVMAGLVASAGPLGVSIQAVAIERSPILKVKVVGSDADRVVRIANLLVGAFDSYISGAQDSFHVPLYDRMAVRQLASPSAPSVKITRNTEVAVVALLLPLFAGLAVAFAIESLRVGGTETATSRPTQADSVSPPASPSPSTEAVARNVGL